jgi:hypothetical protein
MYNLYRNHRRAIFTIEKSLNPIHCGGHRIESSNFVSCIVLEYSILKKGHSHCSVQYSSTAQYKMNICFLWILGTMYSQRTVYVSSPLFNVVPQGN